MEAIGSSIESVALVVLTHHHPDHTGGLAGVVERSSASVAAHTLEAPIIDGSVRMPNPYRNKLFGAVAVPVVASINGPPVGVDHHLEDGDRLPVGDEIRVVHTPGHTQGSTCLLLEPRGVLIVGDALQYKPVFPRWIESPHRRNNPRCPHFMAEHRGCQLPPNILNAT